MRLIQIKYYANTTIYGTKVRRRCSFLIISPPDSFVFDLHQPTS